MQSYLRDRMRISIIGEEFNLSDKRYKNPQDWLIEINKVYDYSHPGKKARGCALKANDPSISNWVELRRQISLAVPDLRIIFLSRNYLQQYSASIAAMVGTDDQLPVMIDIDHMLGMFGLWELASVKLKQIFGRHSGLHIKHEDLIHQPRRTMNLVFEFLGLGADKEFSAHSESSTLPAEIIKNFDEVQKALRNTKWS
jgi:hypothetical protein